MTTADEIFEVIEERLMGDLKRAMLARAPREDPLENETYLQWCARMRKQNSDYSLFT